MRILVALLTGAALLGLLPDASAAAKVRVVASTQELKSLVEAVGGDLVEVDGLAKSSQNAHDVELRPSLMAKLRRADLFVTNGLELDLWADALARNANNPRVLFGAPGRVDASVGVPVLEVPTGRIDRSMGDVHPQGNPHYFHDPALSPIIMGNIATGLTRIAPEHAAAFETRRKQFVARVEDAMPRWTALMEPVKGQRVVVFHNEWVYLLSRFGIVQAGTVEDRPGIPPSPAHLARLVRQMKEEGLRVLIASPWVDRKLAQLVADEAGAKVVLLAHAVGAVKGTDTYLEMIDHNVKALAQALRPAR
jgi:zinc/manganese transport system substrate-binding protein